MNNDSNSSGRTFFKLAATAAIIALILSISRLFLSASDRSMTEFFTYNLAHSSQMTAFLAVILIAILLIIIGSILPKEHDLFSTPMIAGGVLSLFYVTIATYLIQSYSREVGDSAALAELVLTLVIAVEWLILVIFTWRTDSKTSTNSLTPASSLPKEETKI